MRQRAKPMRDRTATIIRIAARMATHHRAAHRSPRVDRVLQRLSPVDADQRRAQDAHPGSSGGLAHKLQPTVEADKSGP